MDLPHVEILERKRSFLRIRRKLTNLKLSPKTISYCKISCIEKVGVVRDYDVSRKNKQMSLLMKFMERNAELILVEEVYARKLSDKDIIDQQDWMIVHACK